MMMPKKFAMYVLLICLFVLTSLSLGAQEDVTYRLRVPDAEEYLAVIPDALAAYQDELPDYYTKSTYQPMVDIIDAELRINYSGEEIFGQPFDLLANAYSAMEVGSAFMNYEPSLENDVNWMMGLFEAWLRENPIDLAATDSLDIPGIRTGIQPAIDFDGDGKTEYQVNISNGYYRTILVLQEDASLGAGKYRLLETPLPVRWHGIYPGPARQGDLIIESLGFEDINNDSITEWTVFIGETGTYYDWGKTCGMLYVLNYDDGKLVNRFAQDSSSLCLPDPIEFVNLDDDDALEIRQNSVDKNAWYCTWIEAQIHDWDGSSYILESEETLYEDTLGCAMYQAESLLWELEYEAAIPWYERGLAAGWDNASYAAEPHQQREMTQYAQTRLALAYALADREAEAGALIGELQSISPESGMISDVVAAITEAPLNAMAQCTAAFNVFKGYQHNFYTYSLPSAIIVGQHHGPCCVGDNAPPEPEKAGCNVPALIEGLITQNHFNTSISPVTQLEALNIEVESFMTMDLNQDGMDEWLVWLVADVDPLFFSPTGSNYHVSRPPVRRPAGYTDHSIRLLPDNNRAMLVDWIYVDSTEMKRNYDYQIDTRFCANEDMYSLGSVALWQMIDLELSQMLTMPLCDYQSITELFPDEIAEFEGWAPEANIQPDYRAKFFSAVYVWDAIAQNYVVPGLATQPVIDARQTYDPLSALSETNPELALTLVTDAGLFEAMPQALSAYKRAKPSEALSILDNVLRNVSPEVNAIVLKAAHYYRALALEALNRPDEALAEYVAIYEAAPDSAWGMLAALHLEVVETE